MSRPDYERAREYVLNRLTHELPDGLYYHGIHHTRDDVVPAAVRLAVLAGLGETQTLILKTAALYHDIGYIQQYEVNEDIATGSSWQLVCPKNRWRISRSCCVMPIWIPLVGRIISR